MWIIGDIHGCLEELDLLLKEIPAKAPLLFIGDYIDRGPDSAGVVSRLLAERDRSIYLLGNHEAMLLNFFENPQSYEGISWLLGMNGGRATLASYGVDEISDLESCCQAVPPEHYTFYRNLRLYFENEKFIAVHAGLRVDKGLNIKLQKKEDLIWIREEWLSQEHLWKGKMVYYGHTPSRFILGIDRQNEPIRGEKSIGIDTGCIFGGSLSAIDTESGQLLQIPSRQPNL